MYRKCATESTQATVPIAEKTANMAIILLTSECLTFLVATSTFVGKLILKNSNSISDFTSSNQIINTNVEIITIAADSIM